MFSSFLGSKKGADETKEKKAEKIVEKEVAAAEGGGGAKEIDEKDEKGKAEHKLKFEIVRGEANTMAAVKLMANATGQLGRDVGGLRNASLLALGTYWVIRNPPKDDHEDKSGDGEGGWGGGTMPESLVPSLDEPKSAMEELNRAPVPVADGDLAEQEDLLREMGHWCRAAFSAYAANTAELAERLHVPEEDIAVHYPKSSSLVPAFAVAVDKEAEAVVLLVRGTNSLQDVMTDLGGDAIPFCGGLAHEGMAHSVRLMLGLETREAAEKEMKKEEEEEEKPKEKDAEDEDVSKDGEVVDMGVQEGGKAAHESLVKLIERLLGENEGFRLVVAGHSLGGGVASLITMELARRVKFPTATRRRFAEFWETQKRRGELDDDEKDLGPLPAPPSFSLQRTPIHGYTYGVPPVADAVLAASNAGLVTSILNGHDVVPRLGLAAIQRFYREIWETQDKWLPEVQKAVHDSDLVQHAIRAKNRLDSLAAAAAKATESAASGVSGLVDRAALRAAARKELEKLDSPDDDDEKEEDNSDAAFASATAALLRSDIEDGLDTKETAQVGGVLANLAAPGKKSATASYAAIGEMLATARDKTRNAAERSHVVAGAANLAAGAARFGAWVGSAAYKAGATAASYGSHAADKAGTAASPYASAVDGYLRSKGILKDDEDEEEDEDARIRRERGVVDLFPPGFLFHFKHPARPLTREEAEKAASEADKDTVSAKDVEQNIAKARITRATLEQIQRIRVTPYMVDDHLGPGYLGSFQSIGMCPHLSDSQPNTKKQ